MEPSTYPLDGYFATGVVGRPVKEQHSQRPAYQVLNDLGVALLPGITSDRQRYAKRQQRY